MKVSARLTSDLGTIADRSGAGRGLEFLHFHDVNDTSTLAW